MARFQNYAGASKTIAATTAQTLVFPANEIFGAGVIAYDVLFTGGADIADISAIRVKASGDRILDASPAQLRTFIEGTHKTGDTQATTATFLHIPLYQPTAFAMEERDSCQFPAGAQPQVEIDLLNTVPAGSAILGWTTTDTQPTKASRIYRNVLNFSASQDNARYPLADGGFIKGIVVNTVGVERIRLVLSGREIFDMPGPLYGGAATGSMIQASRMGESPITITDPFFIPVTAGIQAASGSSFIEMDTGASWAGVANEIVVWSMLPVAGSETGNGG